MFQRIHETHRTSLAFVLQSVVKVVNVNYGEVVGGGVMRVGEG